MALETAAEGPHSQEEEAKTFHIKSLPFSALVDESGTIYSPQYHKIEVQTLGSRQWVLGKMGALSYILLYQGGKFVPAQFKDKFGYDSLGEKQLGQDRDNATIGNGCHEYFTKPSSEPGKIELWGKLGASTGVVAEDIESILLPPNIKIG